MSSEVSCPASRLVSTGSEVVPKTEIPGTDTVPTGLDSKRVGEETRSPVNSSLSGGSSTEERDYVPRPTENPSETTPPRSTQKRLQDPTPRNVGVGVFSSKAETPHWTVGSEGPTSYHPGPPT